MTPVKKANLIEILKLDYPNLCLSQYDILVIRNDTDLKGSFYPLNSDRFTSKKGFYGKTLIWNGYKLKSGECKIGLKQQTSPDYGTWTDVMTFNEEGDALKIYKTMKFKIFW